MPNQDRLDYNHEALELASEYGRMAVFQYEKEGTRSIEKRRLLPQEIQTNHDNTLVIGYDPDRGGIRAYRLDRVVGFVKIG